MFFPIQILVTATYSLEVYMLDLGRLYVLHLFYPL